MSSNDHVFYFLLLLAFLLPVEASDINHGELDEHQKACWIWNNIDLSAQSDCGEILLYQGDISLQNQHALFTKWGFNPFKVEIDTPIVLVVRLYDLVDGTVG